MTTFYIFRHGDTIETDNPIIRFFGHKNNDSHDIDILPKATYALLKIGEYLKDIPTNANFTSPYPRCIHSSEIVTRTSGKNFTPDNRLREIEKNGETLKQLDNIFAALDRFIHYNIKYATMIYNVSNIAGFEPSFYARKIDKSKENNWVDFWYETWWKN